MNKHGEPWTVGGHLTDQLLDAEGKRVAEFFSRAPMNRALDCVNALAGLEPGDVATTLVELVRRTVAKHDSDAQDQTGFCEAQCGCDLCRDACPLIARLPEIAAQGVRIYNHTGGTWDCDECGTRTKPGESHLCVVKEAPDAE